uniref:Uncharacterized protein n=1 Tax=Anguilla anguilla TaxID=7936 RepID=A0A0E9XGR4_ANGAN
MSAFVNIKREFAINIKITDIFSGVFFVVLLLPICYTFQMNEHLSYCRFHSVEFSINLDTWFSSELFCKLPICK